ncbi:MAG: hypothetical protein ACX939_13685, partial [Hyphococcus sp.]
EVDFLAASAGAPGLSAYELWLGQGNTGTLTDYQATLVGDPGAPGADGADGLSAYQIWLNEGNSGTEQDFLNALTADATAGAESVLALSQMTFGDFANGAVVAVDRRVAGAPGGAGPWVKLEGDYSAHVAADPMQIAFVAPLSDPTGASGVWARQFGKIYPEHAGITGANDNAADNIDDRPAFQAIADLMAFLTTAVGQKRVHLHIPAGDYRMSGEVVFNASRITVTMEGHATNAVFYGANSNGWVFGGDDNADKKYFIYTSRLYAYNEDFDSTAGAGVLFRNCGRGRHYDTWTANFFDGICRKNNDQSAFFNIRDTKYQRTTKARSTLAIIAGDTINSNGENTSGQHYETDCFERGDGTSWALAAIYSEIHDGNWFHGGHTLGADYGLLINARHPAPRWAISGDYNGVYFDAAAIACVGIFGELVRSHRFIGCDARGSGEITTTRAAWEDAQGIPAGPANPVGIYCKPNDGGE